ETSFAPRSGNPRGRMREPGGGELFGERWPPTLSGRSTVKQRPSAWPSRGEPLATASLAGEGARSGPSRRDDGARRFEQLAERVERPHQLRRLALHVQQ